MNTVRRLVLAPVLAWACSTTVSHAQTDLPIPDGTKVYATFVTEDGKGAENLVDGNPETVMIGKAGSAPDATAPVSICFRFPTPLKGLGGVRTGKSDPFGNYFPVKMEFWVDSDGDGTYDTKVGSADGLGPNDKSVGEHRFSGRLNEVRGLEVRVTEQSSKAMKRAFQMDEIGLLADTSMPLIAATPVAPKKTQLLFVEPMPVGTTATATVKTEEGKGADKLLDGDPNTVMNPAQGSAKPEGQSDSIFLRFPAPVENLAGVKLGRSDPFGNYVWQTIEIWADTTGSGKYDAKVATITGGKEAEYHFDTTLPKASGLELRITKTKQGAAGRSAILSEIPALVFADDAGDKQNRVVLEDFEDFSSWRTWAINTDQPPDERYYGQNIWLCGIYDPKSAKSGQGVGQFRYWFKKNGEPNRMWAKRGIIGDTAMLIDRLEFWANSQGYPAKIWFELLDSKGKKFETPKIDITGTEWKNYGVDLSVDTIPQIVSMEPPYRVEIIFMESPEGGKGDVLIDDITAIGAAGRTKRAQVRRIFDGMAYNPDAPVVPKYLVRNGSGAPLQTNLEAVLYSSFDPKFTTPLKTVSVPVNLPVDGSAEVAVDFGALGTGHYQAKLHLEAPGVAVDQIDQIPVMVLNGKRINESPMWFGAQHPSDWIAEAENNFVYENVVGPLGLDIYRVGAPRPALIKLGVLQACGITEMPPHLRLPDQQNDVRGEPNDYDAYYDWLKKLATEKFLPYKDSIASIEFYNEPELPNFCFLPEFDTYARMHRVFSRAFREVIPGVQIGTGGNTVIHGKAKKDFNERTYVELAKETDVALWHAHGPLENYVELQRQVEKWLAAGGRPLDQQKLGNSETGITSAHSSVDRLRQAETLVKKAAWAKAQPTSYFHLWFTTTDTFDPQSNDAAMENWGLVTANQRFKPSGQAYNELIRQLANTKPLSEVALDPRLQTMHFSRKDGENVWVTWPRQEGAKFVQPLAASGPVTVTNIFGGSLELTPQNGRINLEVEGSPLYVNAAPGVTVSAAKGVEYASFPSSIGGTPGSTVSLPVEFKNIWNKPVVLDAKLVSNEGGAVSEARVSLAAGATATQKFEIPVAKDLAWGTHGYTLQVSSADAGLAPESLPVTLSVAQIVPKATGLKADGSKKALPANGTIVLNTKDDAQDLVFDPSTPFWANPDDLSVTARFAHDEKGIFASFEVKDQTHIPGPAGSEMWKSDSIQFAISADGKNTMVGLTSADGGSSFVWNAADQALAGKPLATPFKVTQTGSTTTYEVFLPFEMLGFKYTPGLLIRSSFLVNEDDGRGRVRVMRWFDGIARGRNVSEFGFMILE